MSHKPAFTFIEVLLATSLFAVGMLSVLEILPASRIYLSQSGYVTQATLLAQQELETVRGVPYSSLSVGAYEAEHAVTSDSTNQLNQFQRQTTVTLVNPESSPSPYATSDTDLGMKRVDVTVYWYEKKRARQITLSTYVYQT